MDDPLKDFDKNLQEFYFDVIKKEVDLSARWKCHSIRRALSDVVKAYKKRPRRKSDIRFDTPYRRCAYLLKHSPCFTSAVANYFYKFVEEHNNLLEKAFKSGNLSICCLGGGPATDAVAVLHIIRHLYQPHWHKDHRTLKVSVTVVDISEEWRETATNVLDCLKKTPEFFGRGEMELKYEFFTADLTGEMDKQLQASIKSADIVTMIYFLSAVTGTRGRKTSEDMVEKIMLAMKKEAFVFFLDSAVDKHYEILNKASEKRNVMLEIYGPLVEEFHTISIDSVKSFLNLYSKHFHRLICMTYMFFCVSSWKKPLIKVPQRIIRREILEGSPSTWDKPTEKESDELTQRMKQYRSAVYKLVNKTYSSAISSRPNYGHKKLTSNSSSFGEIHRETWKADSKWKGTMDIETRKLDSTYTSNPANLSVFRRTDLEHREANSTTDSDLASSRNFSSSNSSSPNNGLKKQTSNSSSFEEIHRETWKADSKWKGTMDIETRKLDSTYTSNPANLSVFRRTDLEHREANSTTDSDLASSRNFSSSNSSSPNNGLKKQTSNSSSFEEIHRETWKADSKWKGTMDIETRKLDSTYTSNPANLSVFSRADLEHREANSTTDSDLASSRNFRKINLENRKADSTNKTYIVGSRNFVKSDWRKPEPDSRNSNNDFADVSMARQKRFQSNAELVNDFYCDTRNVKPIVVNSG